MFELNEINRNIENIIRSNNYQDLIKNYKYVFFKLVDEDNLKFFWIKTEEMDIQFILDFRNQLYYLCRSNQVVTIGERIPDFEYQQIVRCYNCEKSNQKEGMINIGKIIKSVSEE